MSRSDSCSACRRSCSGNVPSRRRPALEEDDARRLRRDLAELVLRGVCRAISASAPAISTPVGPPPITTNVSSRRCAPPSAVRSACSKAISTRRLNGQRVVQRLEAGGEWLPLVVAEVGVRDAGGHNQRVVRQVADVEARRPCARRRPTARRPAAPARWSGAAGRSGWARRCRRATAPPSPPGRAAAGTGGGWRDRRATTSTRASLEGAGRAEAAESAADDDDAGRPVARSGSGDRTDWRRQEPRQTASSWVELIVAESGAVTHLDSAMSARRSRDAPRAPAVTLLVPQRLDRVQARRAHRGPVARDDPGERRRPRTRRRRPTAAAWPTAPAPQG